MPSVRKHEKYLQAIEHILDLWRHASEVYYRYMHYCGNFRKFAGHVAAWFNSQLLRTQGFVEFRRCRIYVFWCSPCNHIKRKVSGARIGGKPFFLCDLHEPTQAIFNSIIYCWLNQWHLCPYVYEKHASCPTHQYICIVISLAVKGHAR